MNLLASREASFGEDFSSRSKHTLNSNAYWRAPQPCAEKSTSLRATRLAGLAGADFLRTRVVPAEQSAAVAC